MKKFGWKKILVLLIALVLCFSMAACVPEEEEVLSTEVKANEFLTELLDGVGGMLNVLGDKTSTTRHLDVTLVAKVTEGDKKQADIKIRIAGNFETVAAKNEVLLEVSSESKLMFGIYEKANKVYFEESVTSGTKQKLSIEGVAAINVQKYLAQLPAMLQGLLGGFDMKDISDTVLGVASMADDILKIDKKTEEGGAIRYNAELVVMPDEEADKNGLGAIIGAIGGILKDYTGIINKILPSILGIKFSDDASSVLPGIEGQTSYPKVSVIVDMDASKKFSGLSFGYKWPKDGNFGNDLDIEIGLQNIVMDTASTEVVGINTSEYKPGALKVSAELKIPNLTAAGFTLKADFFIQPGFGSIGGSAAEENEMIKVQLTAESTISGNKCPLTAEYKYVDVKANGKTDDQMIDVWDGEVGNFVRKPSDKDIRVGRLYFDIDALTRLGNVDVSNTGTKFFKEIDIADLLLGAVNPTQKTQVADTTGVDGLSGYTVTAHYKTTKNAAYYQKYQTFGSGDFLWVGFDIKNSKGETVGTVVSSESDALSRTDFLIIGDNKYSIKVTFASILAAMANETEKTTVLDLTIAKAAGEEVEKAPERDFYKFNVYGGGGADATIVKTVYLDAAKTEVGAKAEDISDIVTTLISTLKADAEVTRYLAPGMEAEIYVVYQTGAGAFTLKTVAEIVADGKKTTEQWLLTTVKPKNIGVLTPEPGNKYLGDLVVVYKNAITKDVDTGNIEAAYKAFVDAEMAKVDNNGVAIGESFINSKLGRWTNGADGFPAISTAIEVNTGSDFNFEIGKLGGLIDLVLGKVSGLTSGSIEINLNDADSILGMGAYLKTKDLFAAQIRMLLSSEKDGQAYKDLSLASPYMAASVSEKVVLGGITGTSAAGVATAVKTYNKYLSEEAFQHMWASVYGNKGAEEYWTAAQKTAYANATTELAKANAYAKAERDSYESHRDANALEYDKYVKGDISDAKYGGGYEKKALDFIRGYIGGKNSSTDTATALADVKTMKEFLYGKTGTDGLSIKVSFTTDSATSIITGMPVSFKIEILRGGVTLGSISAGTQFVEASNIPSEVLDWSSAKSVHETIDVGGKQISKLVYNLLMVHKNFSGIDMTTAI